MDNNALSIVPENEGPELHTMARADAPAIWEDFRTQLIRLKSTAETLVVKDASQTAEMKIARTTRLSLKSLRVEIENKRKELGEEALRRKQKIDSAAKELREIIEPLEQRLLQQEQFVEIQEAKRKAALSESRSNELRPFVADTTLYNLADMPDEAYAELLAGSKAAHQAKIERERKEREASEAKAKADAEERERIKLENERLRKERAEIEAKAAKEKAAADAAARKEREARQKIERELAEKEAKEKAEKAAQVAAEKKAAAAPDKKKLIKFAADVRALQIPEFMDLEIQNLINAQCVKFAVWIEKQAESL